MPYLIQDLFYWGLPFVTAFLARVAIATIIFFCGRSLAQLIQRLVKKAMTRTQLDPTLTVFASNITFYGIMAVVVIAALSQLGVQTTSLVAALGAAGLAIGLALQGSLTNFAAGILIIIFHPFRVGDVIEAGAHIGSVTEIQLFTTALTTGDNRTVIVPNSQLTENSLVNYSTLGQRRIDLVASVDYAADIDRVKQILMALLTADARILTEPAPAIALLEMADSSLDFAVRPWVENADYWAVRCDLQEAIKKRLDAEGINIPFPQRDVRIVSPSTAAEVASIS